jgi:BirA family biotin operon repressor/biotin-[acetyl-CoA-carboxylase] ligase
VSVLARPAVAGVEVLSLRAGLAVAELLDRLGARRPIALKWPNDLMLDGRKTGGILCEARWQGQALGWVAIGLGVNVTNRPASGLEDTATRLAETLPDVGPEALLMPVIEALRTVDAGAGHLSDEECVRFARRDWLRGRALEAPVPGTALGVAPDGALLVRHPDGGTIAVRAGSVVLAEKAVTENLRPCS